MEPSGFLIAALFASFIVVLLLGVPVAYALGGMAVLFTAIAMFCDQFLGTATGLDFNVFSLVIHRIYQLMENWLLVALPMFIFMGPTYSIARGWRTGSCAPCRTCSEGCEAEWH